MQKIVRHVKTSWVQELHSKITGQELSLKQISRLLKKHGLKPTGDLASRKWNYNQVLKVLTKISDNMDI